MLCGAGCGFYKGTWDEKFQNIETLRPVFEIFTYHLGIFKLQYHETLTFDKMLFNKSGILTSWSRGVTHSVTWILDAIAVFFCYYATELIPVS